VVWGVVSGLLFGSGTWLQLGVVSVVNLVVHPVVLLVVTVVATVVVTGVGDLVSDPSV